MFRFLRPFRLETQSLALYRICIAIFIIFCPFAEQGDVSTSNSQLNFFFQPFQTFATTFNRDLPFITDYNLIQYILTTLLFFTGLLLLVGYKTRLAAILSFCLCSIAYVCDLGQFPSIGNVLIPMLFWSMFLPLGAAYSLDSATNISRPLANSILSSSTIALIVQQCFNYWVSNSPFSLVTEFGLQNDSLALIRTLSLIEILGPLLLLVPFQVTLCRLTAIVSFIILHLIASLFFGQSLLVFLLAIATWLVFLPKSAWEKLSDTIDNDERKELVIYYDADCGFCKKVVHVLRTLLILSGTPLLTAQSNVSIYEAMQTYNSWVVVDWQQKRHFKFEAIAYICSLSPIFFVLEPILRYPLITAAGTRFYEAIANNRRRAGLFTRFLKFAPRTTKVSKIENFISGIFLTAYITYGLFILFLKID